ncbi:bifunctional oligoribonuclease/PAP phosphatase NrnA [Corynebacterium choanae]|uniref:Bifunctional oligoribonuclease and PAP phosphatase NrnA n=1 Tax=Corynebacterium choanae TaxID=1862358 RepID=A0A3G6J6W7_9CORY|nr:DHH family phosphoesterase [Corynebacterium choanae]AZA13817.1 Bifunctional oligoribonuclease and PAP phosphatase NrnA [Corynebacterium choanae]
MHTSHTNDLHDSSLFADEQELDFPGLTEFVAQGTSFAVVGHIRPDGDAIGSVTAVVEQLRQMALQACGVIGQSEPLQSSLLTIPGADQIATCTTLPQVDRVITVDCGDLQRCGSLADEIAQFGPAGTLAVIDHHATNRGFGSLNCIAAGWESTTMVLWRWMLSAGMSITPRIAASLYAGLLTDTGSFRWGTGRMHAMAQALLSLGVDGSHWSMELLDRRRADELAMMGRVLATTTVCPVADTNIRFVALTAAHHIIAGVDHAAVEALTDHIRAVDGADFGVLLKEFVPGTYQVSFRSTATAVAQIASALGGGGHTFASGATVHAATPQQALDAIAAAAHQAYANR